MPNEAKKVDFSDRDLNITIFGQYLQLTYKRSLFIL